MGEQIEQLWVTWSSVGLTGFTHGMRIRAASPGLLDMQSSYFTRVIAPHREYVLPEGTTDLRNVKFQEAPVCLSFINVNKPDVNEPDGRKEWLLVRKQYIGRDLEGRPGNNFFIHLLAGLPKHDFTARDAIDLWLPAQDPKMPPDASAIWAVSEAGLSLRETTLPYMPYEKLIANRQVLECPTWLDLEGLRTYLPQLIHDYVLFYLSQLIRNFVLSYRVEQRVQRFCLGSSSSNRIASLIWGLLHCLPLEWVRDLTFTTYESEISKHKPDLTKSDSVIVGMSWLASQKEHNASTVPNFGVAVRSFDCDTDTPPSPPTVLPDLMRYAQYATHCVMTGNLNGLDNFLQEAKNEEKTGQLEDFLNFYITEIEGKPFTQQQCASILDLKKIGDWKEIRRPRFVQDLFMWINQDPSWWQSGIEKKVSDLHTRAEQFNKQGRADATQVLRNVAASLADFVLGGLQETIRNKDWQHFRFLLDVLQTASPPATDTTYWPMLLKTFVQDRGILSDANWAPFRSVLDVLATVSAPAWNSRFWSAFEKLLTAYKKELLQLTSYQDRNGQNAVWVPFVYLMEKFATFAPPVSYDKLWATFLTILTEELSTLVRSQWLPFVSLLQNLQTVATPAPDSPFWSALLAVVKTNKREMQKLDWKPLIDLLNILASPGNSDPFYLGLLDVLDNDAEEIKNKHWSLYEKLMTHWGGIAALERDPHIQQHWLPVPTEQLEAFFALARSLPKSWYTEAIKTYIANARGFNQTQWQTVVVVVTRNIHPFTHVLRSLVLIQEHGWDQIAAGFFERFVQEHTFLIQEYTKRIKDCKRLAKKYKTSAQEQDELAQQYRECALQENNRRILENDGYDPAHARHIKEYVQEAPKYTQPAQLAQQYTQSAQEHRGRAQEQSEQAQQHTAFVEQLRLDKVVLLATVLYLEDLTRAINSTAQVRLPATTIANRLLEATQLNEVETVQLLKLYGIVLMSAYGPLLAIRTLLWQYFVQLDVKDLDDDSTQNFLAATASQLNLAKTHWEEWDALQRLVWSWNSLGSFISSKPGRRLTLMMLRNVSRAIEIIIYHCPDAGKQDKRKSITNRLLPLLAETIMTEQQLGRVLDYLAPLLAESKEPRTEEELALQMLQSLCRPVGARFENAGLNPLIPYIKMVLERVGDVYGTDIENLDIYVTECFKRLKLNLRDKNVVDSLSQQASQDWPEGTRATWESYLLRNRPAPPPPPMPSVERQPAAMNTNGKLSFGGVSVPEKPRQQEPVPLILSNQPRQFPASPQLIPPNVSFPSPVAQKPVSRGILSSIPVRDVLIGAGVGLTLGFIAGFLVWTSLLAPLALPGFSVLGLLVGALIGIITRLLLDRKEPLEEVASVKGHSVSRTLFEQVSVLKYPYVDYRYNYVNQQLLEGEQQRRKSQDLTHRFIYAERDRLQNQLTTLRIRGILEQEVLEELVDDCLITDWMQEAINEHQFDYGQVVTYATDDLIHFQELREYAPLPIQHSLSEQDVANVLAIFARRSLFAQHLFNTQNGLSLENWLDAQKKEHARKIKRHLAVRKPEKKKRWNWPAFVQSRQSRK